MFNGEDDKTMIKTPEIKDDYEMRLYGKKKKKIILKIENQESTKDEISYVQYKVLQLDQKLENSLEIYYESQEKESELFKSYFN